jgi:signal transduction histidine kinase
LSDSSGEGRPQIYNLIVTEVIRLLRLSLILRIGIAALVAVALGVTIGNNILVSLLVTLPTIALLGLTSVALARGWNQPRFVNGLLIATMIAQTFEEVAMRLLLRADVLTPSVGGDFPRGPRGPGEFLVARGLFGGALLTAVPAVLGAWISGKRGAIPWALFAVGVNAVGELITIFPNYSAARFITGPVVSQGVVVAVLAYFVGSLADQQRDEQRQLEQANRQLAEQARVREQLAASRERVRLGRDLHDTLAHTLAGLVVQMNAISTLLDKEPDVAKRELRKAQAAAKTGLEETRAAISDLRTNIVEDLGLSGALQRQVDLLQQRGANITFEQQGDEPQLTKDQAETLFRIAQEALNNVERHAEAKNVAVRLRSPNGMHGGIVMSIKDDGVGFDTSVLDDDRFGLRGMRERAELIGAHLRVDSAPNQGTTVTVTLKPVNGFNNG